MTNLKEGSKRILYGNDDLEADINHDSDNVIQLVEREYPELMAEFRRIQREQYNLFAIKHHDYGPGNISMGTDLKDTSDVKLSLTALVVRINDKVNRLINLIIKRDVEGEAEPVMDAFADLAVYGIIAQIVKNGKWHK